MQARSCRHGSARGYISQHSFAFQRGKALAHSLVQNCVGKQEIKATTPTGAPPPAGSWAKSRNFGTHALHAVHHIGNAPSGHEAPPATGTSIREAESTARVLHCIPRRLPGGRRAAGGAGLASFRLRSFSTAVHAATRTPPCMRAPKNTPHAPIQAIFDHTQIIEDRGLAASLSPGPARRQTPQIMGTMGVLRRATLPPAQHGASTRTPLRHPDMSTMGVRK